MINNMSFNPEKCLARLSSDINKQCKHNQKLNTYFCGLHLKSKNVNRIDEPVNINNKLHLKLITFMDIEITKYENIKNKSIIYTLEYYKISYTSNKKRNYNVLTNFLRLLNNYNINIVIKLQSIIRRFNIINRNYYKGPALFKRNLINNECDFLTFNKCKDIEYSKFFSYKDIDGFIYAFNIDSIKYLVDHNQENPYNRNSFTNECIENIKKCTCTYDYKNSISKYLQPSLNDYDKMKQLCVNVFQRMDELELYTQPRWFLDLSIQKLKILYIQIEDIWNYRASLTPLMKCKYTNNGKAFTYSTFHIKKIDNKLKLQNILLKEFKKFAFEGHTQDDCITSCYWILIGLTTVSKDAADGCPELVQSHNI